VFDLRDKTMNKSAKQLPCLSFILCFIPSSSSFSISCADDCFEKPLVLMMMQSSSSPLPLPDQNWWKDCRETVKERKTKKKSLVSSAVESLSSSASFPVDRLFSPGNFNRKEGNQGRTWFSLDQTEVDDSEKEKDDFVCCLWRKKRLRINRENENWFRERWCLSRFFCHHKEPVYWLSFLTTSKKNHSIDLMMAISFSSSLHWHLISQAITGDLFSHFVSLELERFPLILSRESKTRVLTVQSLFFTRSILVIIEAVFSLCHSYWCVSWTLDSVSLFCHLSLAGSSMTWWE